MRKASVTDSFFLGTETPQVTMNIGGLTVLDPSDTATGQAPTRDALLRYVQARLHLAPNLRRRLVFHPLGLDEPRLVDDPDFDIAFHVRHLALPRPHDWQALKTLTAQLLAAPMDLQRPLWELTLIEGLEQLQGVPPCAYAFVIKLHHAVFDGAAVGATLWALMQDTPEEEPPPPDKPWVAADPAPALRDWLGSLLPDGTRQWLDSVGALSSLSTQLSLQLAGAAQRSLTEAPLPAVQAGQLLAPRTRFQRPVSSHRTWDFISLPMAELQILRAALGKPKVNELMLAIIGGGMRRYLLRHGELPGAPLLALCPVSTREAAAIEGGNHLSAMRISLGTDIEDPRARLAAVTQSSAAAKASAESLGPDFMVKLLALNPYPLRTRLLGGLSTLRERFDVSLPPLANLVVSNAPPPKGGHYFAGSRVITAPAFGPLFPDCALLHAITGLDFESTIAVTSCHPCMPDIGFYMDCLRASVEEYQALAAGVSAAAVAADQPAQPALPQSPTKPGGTRRRRSRAGAATARSSA